MTSSLRAVLTTPVTTTAAFDSLFATALRPSPNFRRVGITTSLSRPARGSLRVTARRFARPVFTGHCSRSFDHVIAQSGLTGSFRSVLSVLRVKLPFTHVILLLSWHTEICGLNPRVVGPAAVRRDPTLRPTPAPRRVYPRRVAVCPRSAGRTPSGPGVLAALVHQIETPASVRRR